MKATGTSDIIKGVCVKVRLPRSFKTLREKKNGGHGLFYEDSVVFYVSQPLAALPMDMT